MQSFSIAALLTLGPDEFFLGPLSCVLQMSGSTPGFYPLNPSIDLHCTSEFCQIEYCLPYKVVMEIS